MTQFISLDSLAWGVLLLSVFTGFFRGFTKEFFSLVNWVVAFFIASFFSGRLAREFIDAKSMQSSVQDVPGFAVTAAQDNSLTIYIMSFAGFFFTSLIIGYVISRHICRDADHGGGILSRLVASFVATIRGVLLIFLMVFLLSLSTIANDPWVFNSAWANGFRPYIKLLTYKVEPNIDALRSKSPGNEIQGNIMQGIGGPGL